MQAINEPAHHKRVTGEAYPSLQPLNKRESCMNNTTGFNIPCDQRQLFLDDVGIEHLENLTRTLHQPSKKGAVVRSAEPDPDDPDAHRTGLGSRGGSLQVLGYRDG